LVTSYDKFIDMVITSIIITISFNQPYMAMIMIMIMAMIMIMIMDMMD